MFTGKLCVSVSIYGIVGSYDTWYRFECSKLVMEGAIGELLTSVACKFYHFLILCIAYLNNNDVYDYVYDYDNDTHSPNCARCRKKKPALGTTNYVMDPALEALQLGKQMEWQEVVDPSSSQM